MMVAAGYKDPNTRKKVQRYAQENMKKVWNCGYISKMRKMQICLFTFSFPAYVVLYRIYKKKYPVA